MVRVPQKSIRTKVFTAFFVLFAIGVATFFYSYVGIVKLFDTFSSAPASTNKLTLINQTLVKIYESETNAKLYAASGDFNYLENYTRQNEIIDSNLQVLRNISLDAAQQLQLVNVLVLQAQKTKVIDDIIKLKMTDVKRNDYADLIRSQPDSIRLQYKQKLYSSSNLSAATGAPMKKRTFFERFKALFKDEPVPVGRTNLGVKHQIDSSMVTQVRVDENLDDLKHKIRQMKAREDKIFAEINKREIDLLKREKLLNDRILYQITKMSQEEIRINNEQMARFDMAALLYKQRLILLGISSFFIVLIFLFLIFRDVQQSARMQRQLEDSNFQIQELLKVKERFLANMSHEIRTPLSAITGFSDYLMKKKVYSEEEMSAINSSAKHLNSIVNEILDYSKVESNAIEFDYTVFSLEALLNEIVLEMKIKSQEKHIGLRLNVGDIPTFVKMDRLRLKQVLLNLISNAVKFTNEGEVVVNATRRKDLLVIDVVDTGIGIPEAAQAKIFEEFTQADGSVARKFGGTGLGLSISKKLVSLMGGTLTLVSAENTGSTFSAKFEWKNIAATETSKKAISAPIGYKERVLFIDDDDFVRLLVSKLLKSNSIEYDEANNGIEGVELFRKGLYGLVITDLHMPKMSGIEVAKRVKSINENIKILFLSADMSQTMVDEMYQVGADAVLQKPFTEEELMTVIYEIISQPALSSEKEEELPICNISKITAFIGDDSDELKVIINAFLSSTEESMMAIAQNNRVGNEQLVADRAHKMLTGFRQFDIVQGIELLREIEKCRNGKYLSEVQSEINALQSLWMEVKRYLEKYL